MTRVVWQQGGDWQLIDGSGLCHEATLAPTSWLHPWAMCLRFNYLQGGSVALMVWRWQLSAAQWHAWRQRLVLQGTANSRSSTELRPVN